jgi:rSAM/selenodomain-associated transferase 1
MRQYCAVIPAYQNDATIGSLVSAVRRQGLAVAVVDDGSRDRTAAIAAGHGAVVLRHASNAGKGCALRRGFAYALREGFDGVLTMDADGQHSPDDIPALLRVAAEHPAAVIIGNRMRAPAEMPWVRRAANLLGSAIVSAVSGQSIPDSQSGFRLVPRGVLEAMTLRSTRYELETELLLAAAAAGAGILSVPVKSVYDGQRSHVRWWRDLPRFFWTVGRHVIGDLGGHEAQAPKPRSPRGAHRRVLVFLKEPVPWQVKTRLAASIGAPEAAQLYQACAEETLCQLAPLTQDTVIYADPPEALERVRRWVGHDWTVRPQHGSTLGTRLAQAFDEAFADGATRVVVIGTDAPWLSARHVERAFAALDESDVVIGPSEDGGYYLLGVSRPVPALFEAIPWSTRDVYASTIAAAQALRLRVGALRMGYDLDCWEDVQRFMTDARPEAAAPHVRQQIAASRRRIECPS